MMRIVDAWVGFLCMNSWIRRLNGVCIKKELHRRGCLLDAARV